jgi:hypothetical protein
LIYSDRQRVRETERQRVRETERQRDRDRETERETEREMKREMDGEMGRGWGDGDRSAKVHPLLAWGDGSQFDHALAAGSVVHRPQDDSKVRRR